MVVEAGGGTEGAAEIDLLLRPGGDVDGRGVFGLRELDAGNGDRGGTGVPEDGFSGSEFADEVEGLDGGNPCLLEG